MSNTNEPKNSEIAERQGVEKEPSLLSKARGRFETFKNEFGLSDSGLFFNLPKDKKVLFLKQFGAIPEKEIELDTMYCWLNTRAFPPTSPERKKDLNNKYIFSPYPDLEKYNTPLFLSLEGNQKTEKEFGNFKILEKWRLLNPKTWFAYTQAEKESILKELEWFDIKKITEKSLERELDSIFQMQYIALSKKLANNIPRTLITQNSFEDIDSLYEKSVWISDKSSYLGFAKSETLARSDIQEFTNKRRMISERITDSLIGQIDMRTLDIDTKIDLLSDIQSVINGKSKLSEKFKFNSDQKGIEFMKQYGVDDQMIATKFKTTLLAQEKTSAPLQDKKVLQAIEEAEETEEYIKLDTEMDVLAKDMASYVAQEIKNNRDYYEFLAETNTKSSFGYEDFPEDLKQRLDIFNNKLAQFTVKTTERISDAPDWRIMEIARAYTKTIGDTMNSRLRKYITDSFNDPGEGEE